MGTAFDTVERDSLATVMRNFAEDAEWVRRQLGDVSAETSDALTDAVGRMEYLAEGLRILEQRVEGEQGSLARAYHKANDAFHELETVNLSCGLDEMGWNEDIICGAMALTGEAAAILNDVVR